MKFSNRGKLDYGDRNQNSVYFQVGRGRILPGKQGEGASWDAKNVLYIDLGRGFMSAYIYKNSLG